MQLFTLDNLPNIIRLKIKKKFSVHHVVQKNLQNTLV